MKNENSLPATIQQKNSWIFRSTLMIFILIVLCAIATTLSSTSSLGVAVLGSAVIVLGLTPGIIFLANPSRSAFPLFPLNCSFYSLAFGYGVFRKAIVDPRYYVVDSITEQALIYLILGLITQISVYSFAKRLLTKAHPIRFTRNISSQSVLITAWGLIGIRLLQIGLPQLNEIPSFGQFASLCGVVGTAILYSIRKVGPMGSISKILLFCVIVPLEFLMRATTGSIGNLMIYCMLFIIVRWSLDKRVAWSFLATLIIGYVLLAPLKGYYREQTWGGQYSNASVFTKATVYYELISESFFSGSQGIESELLDSTVERFNQLPLYSLVVNNTPMFVPYWGGETLIGTFYVFIPRFLWQDKPVQILGNQFGHRYGILGDADSSTSINLCWNIELYANFGTWGLVLGMGLIGFLFVLIERVAGGDNNFDRIIVIAITLNLAYPESNISLMWGGIFLNTISIYGIFRLISSITRTQESL